MSEYQRLTPFAFHRDGYANRRDADARPRTLVTSITGPVINFHLAGDEYLRTANVADAANDPGLVAGMTPDDALRLGMAVGYRTSMPDTIRIVAGGGDA